MTQKNNIGLKKKNTKKTIESLNQSLSDLQLYYQKLKNFHWNVSGIHFFDLHEKFENLYLDARVKIDELAERILTLGGKPYSNLSSYLEQSSINEAQGIMYDTEMVQAIIEDLGIILSNLRMALQDATEAEDEGTIDLIGAYIREFEKKSWMLSTWTMPRVTKVVKELA